MKEVNWLQVLAFGLVVLIVLALGVGVLLMLGGTWGMIGTGMMGPGHTGSGILWAALWLTVACLLPVTLLTLLVLAGVWLVRNLSSSQEPQQSVEKCPNCGRVTESEWQVCPHCGEELEDEQ